MSNQIWTYSLFKPVTLEFNATDESVADMQRNFGNDWHRLVNWQESLRDKIERDYPGRRVVVRERVKLPNGMRYLLEVSGLYRRRA